MKRLVGLLTSIAVLVGCDTTSTKQLAEAALQLRREELSISLLVVNLRDIYNEPMRTVSQGGIDWKTRYTRIATWIANSQEPPDVLMLQEMPGFWDGLVRDYEAVEFLLNEIKRIRTGAPVEYRIAYLLTNKQSGGYATWPVGESFYPGRITRGGRALLYRPDRVINTQTSAGLSFDSSVGGTVLFNSLPCCYTTNPRDRSVCRLLDGPPVTATSRPGLFPPAEATCSTPAGAAFTRRNLSTNDAAMEAVFSRVELVRQRGNFVHLYNVHHSLKPGAEATILQTVADMEARYFNPVRLYPPIVAGDFNTPRSDIEGRSPSLYPGFEILHWSREVMGVLAGTQAAYLSKQKVLLQPGAVMELPPGGCMPVPNWRDEVPSDPATLWSDHCASIYMKIVPVYDRGN